MTHTSPAVQDFYPDDFSHCRGCGRLNPDGHHFKTRRDGDETVTRYTPAPHETAVPGFVYGGLIAALVDCHAMGAASAAMVEAGGHAVGEVPSPRFVTASLRVDYLKPTPMGVELEARGRIRERTERKAIVEVTVAAGGVITARGEVVAVSMPTTMKR
ncbi:MAG TPA: PaaI family thioesterase [Candidatus Krumholzibacteria bacterium]|nr:PaaI family thioesterase [Candidatus Krumholzibacteria bacterium]